MIENLQYISILIEAIIAIFGIVMAVKKKKIYGYGFFLTFAIYVFWDIIKLRNIALSDYLSYPLFLIATISALWAVYKVYKK